MDDNSQKAVKAGKTENRERSDPEKKNLKIVREATQKRNLRSERLRRKLRSEMTNQAQRKYRGCAVLLRERRRTLMLKKTADMTDGMIPCDTELGEKLGRCHGQMTKTRNGREKNRQASKGRQTA